MKKNKYLKNVFKDDFPLTKFNICPSSIVHKMQREMNELFSRFHERGLDIEEGFFTPSFDLIETDGNYIVKTELAGVDEKDIKVTLSDNILKIEGKREDRDEKKNKKYHRVEVSYGRFERSLELPENVNKDSVVAKFKNGLLEVTVNKKESDTTRIKEIEVKSE